MNHVKLNLMLLAKFWLTLRQEPKEKSHVQQGAGQILDLKVVPFWFLVTLKIMLPHFRYHDRTAALGQVTLVCEQWTQERNEAGICPSWLQWWVSNSDRASHLLLRDVKEIALF